MGSDGCVGEGSEDGDVGVPSDNELAAGAEVRTSAHGGRPTAAREVVRAATRASRVTAGATAPGVVRVG
jgi:hypothetical protein